MKILLSNDDGFLAPGIRCLMKALANLGEVTMVAPDRNRSGVSNSLTLDRPLRATDHGENMISVSGTPTDCVHLAVTGLLTEMPDVVVSGINEGSNLSDDVLYSGTVAAATEGRFLGFPSVAVSLVSRDPQHFDTAAEITLRVLKGLRDKPLANDVILNINVPDIPLSDIKGIKVTRLGTRHAAQNVTKTQDPRGDTVYWVGLPGEAQDAGPGTDFHAVEQGYVSVTPLQIDLTNYKILDEVTDWFENF